MKKAEICHRLIEFC